MADVKSLRKRFTQLRKETEKLDEHYSIKGWGHMFSAKRMSATVRTDSPSAYLSHSEVKSFIEDTGCKVSIGEGEYGPLVRFEF